MNFLHLSKNRALIAMLVVVGWGFFVPFLSARAQPTTQAGTTKCPETCILKSSCESDLYSSGYTGTKYEKDTECEKACGANYGACYGTLRNYPLTIKLGGYPVVNPDGTGDGLADYISNLYIYLLSISGVIAGIIIMYAGFKWMSAGGNSEAVSDAKTKITNALIGIALLLASYLLLQTINPQLTQLKMPPLKILRKLEEVCCQSKTGTVGKKFCNEAMGEKILPEDRCVFDIVCTEAINSVCKPGVVRESGHKGCLNITLPGTQNNVCTEQSGKCVGIGMQACTDSENQRVIQKKVEEKNMQLCTNIKTQAQAICSNPMAFGFGCANAIIPQSQSNWTGTPICIQDVNDENTPCRVNQSVVQKLCAFGVQGSTLFD